MNLRKKPLEVSFSPLTRIVNRSLQAVFDTVPLAPNFLKDPPRRPVRGCVALLKRKPAKSESVLSQPEAQ
jgi:hypothetical protein